MDVGYIKCLHVPTGYSSKVQVLYNYVVASYLIQTVLVRTNFKTAS